MKSLMTVAQHRESRPQVPGEFVEADMRRQAWIGAGSLARLIKLVVVLGLMVGLMVGSTTASAEPLGGEEKVADFLQIPDDGDLPPFDDDDDAPIPNPDLYVERVRTGWDNGPYVEVRVRNQGTYLARSFSVYESESDYSLGFPRLDPGETHTRRWYRNTCEADGVVVVDWTDRNFETNENNNTATWLKIC